VEEPRLIAIGGFDSEESTIDVMEVRWASGVSVGLELELTPARSLSLSLSLRFRCTMQSGTCGPTSPQCQRQGTSIRC